MYESVKANITDKNCNIAQCVAWERHTHPAHEHSIQHDTLFKVSCVMLEVSSDTHSLTEALYQRKCEELHRYPMKTDTLSSIEKAPENQGGKNRGQESREYWATEVFQLSLHASEREHKPSNLLLNKVLRETWSISRRSTENPRWLMLGWEHEPSWLKEFIKLKRWFSSLWVTV